MNLFKFRQKLETRNSKLETRNSKLETLKGFMPIVADV
jgi:hypothetical protein